MSLPLLNISKVIAWLFLLTMITWSKSWYFSLGEEGLYETEIYLDPYYAAANIAGSITGEPIPKYQLKEEEGIYKILFLNSWKLSYGLAEVSLNPMPILGVTLKSQTPSFYRGAEFSQGFNLVEALTTGFPDPGALSFFLGNIASFTDSTGTQRTGSGYSGFLVNLGNYHIRRNDLIADYWVEALYKLKGSNVVEDLELSWSFSLGYKEHFNRGIIDELKFSIKRERTDKKYAGWSLIKNAEIEYLVILNRDKALRFWDYWDETAIRYFLLYGKKFPIKSGKYVLTIGLGVAREIESGYRGALAEDRDQEWTFLLRPNFSF